MSDYTNIILPRSPCPYIRSQSKAKRTFMKFFYKTGFPPIIQLNYITPRCISRNRLKLRKKSFHVLLKSRMLIESYRKIGATYKLC